MTDKVDHLSGDDWKGLYPNLFPDHHKKAKETLETATAVTEIPYTRIPTPPPIQIHAMSGHSANTTICGLRNPTRATSPNQRDLITCPACLALINRRP